MHRSKKEGMSSDSGNPILMGGQLRAVRIEFDIISLITPSLEISVSSAYKIGYINWGG